MNKSRLLPRSHSSLPRWQSLLFLVAVLFIGTPDGVEIVNLTAALPLSVAFIPYGIGMMQANKSPGSGEP